MSIVQTMSATDHQLRMRSSCSGVYLVAPSECNNVLSKIFFIVTNMFQFVLGSRYEDPIQFVNVVTKIFF